MSGVVWLGVAALGAVGALLRYEIEERVHTRVRGDFPFGTVVVNVVGSFCLGLLVGLSVGGDALLLFGTALLGSFTTFSGWMLQTQRLAEDGETRLAVTNLAVSAAAGLGAGAVGWLLGGIL
jgi:fluoride exporter